MSPPIHKRASTADPRPIVLIVDDEEPIAAAMAYIVEDRGCAAATATSGRMALEMVKQGMRPVLTFSDLKMPEVNGEAWLAALRAILGAAMPRIVLMTAAGPHYAIAIAPDAVLAKPFELGEVEALLFRFLSTA